MSKIPYRPPYPEQFRAEAVALVGSSGRPAREIARELGVSYESLRLWVKTVEDRRRRRARPDLR